MAHIAGIGAGVMGRPMAGHLAAHGHSVSIYTRRFETLSDVAAQYHLTPCSTIAQAVMEGNSHFYVTLDGDSRIYDFALPGMLNVVSYAVGDTITFRYIEGDPTSVAQEIVETAVNSTQDSSGQGGSSASDAEDKDGSDGSASGEEGASGQSEEKAA